MELQILQNPAEWNHLRPEWEALVTSQPGTTPFQLPAWLLSWWTHFGSGAPQVMTFRQHDQLVGIIPLFRHEWNGKRQLTLMGSGLSDWTDPIVPPAVLPVLQQYLDEDSSWDVLDWQDLAADSNLATLPGFECRVDTACTEVPFDTTFDAFWAARGPDLRRNIRRYGDRARSAGAIEFGVSSVAAPDLLDALVRLHGARWQQRGETGMIAANHAEGFIRDAAQQFANAGLLRLLSLRFNGQVTAMNFGILFRNEYFAYMSAFDPEQEKHGFGKMLLYEAFRYCFEQRIKVWKFLRGQEAYKLSWGAQAVPKIRLYKAR